MNKTKRLIGTIGIVLSSGLLNPSTYGQPSVTVGVTVPTPSVGVVIHADSDFYEPLASHGEWVAIGAYGRCWRPARVEAGWRPYCQGSWVLTDDGWYWMSDEPWAWATYHYGRWDFTDQYGWYWVPQTQWAPAWVSWHEGGGYVGWAPLQPSVSISVNGYVGFNQSHIPPRAFVFVEQRHFMDPVRSTTVVANNTTVINKTTVITNTKIVNNTVINGGPATTVVEKSSGRKVQAVPVRELRQKQEAPVLVRQKAAAPAADKKEKNVQTPVGSQVKPGGEKTVAAPAPARVEKPNLTPHSPASPTPTGRAKETEKARPVPSQAEPGAEAPQPPVTKEPTPPKNHEAQIEKHKPVVAATESKPAAKPEPRIESSHSAANKPSSEQKADKNVPQRPVKEGPAASEKHDSHPQDKNEEKKIKD